MGKVSESQAQAIAQRLQAGDKTACGECIETYSPTIYRMALMMLGNEADAEDVTQETFLQAFAAIDRFEWRSGLGTWLHRIALNQVLMRRRRRRPLFVSLDAADDRQEPIPPQLYEWCCLPEQDFAASEAQQELIAAVAEMPLALREVFLLREQGQLTTEEAAAVLNLTPANVKVRLHRARRWLRERLAAYYPELVSATQRVAGDQGSTVAHSD